MICNIIDRRKRPHRWAKINAIVEASWHDNSADDADVAPQVVGDVSYDQLEDVSLTDAITWAHTFPGATTLYLYDEGHGV